MSAALLPVMAALGLSFIARPTMIYGQFMLAYELLHVSGDQITGDYPLPDPSRLGPQDLGKAITYARRYALCAVTGLAPGGDDDDAQAAQAAAPARKPRNVPDAQLAAEGRMTRAQAGEHDQLAADTKRQPARATRARPAGHEPSQWDRTGPVDPQTGERDNEHVTPDRARRIREESEQAGIPDHDPEDKPGSIGPGQRRAIEAQLGMLGYDSKDRAGRHAEAAALLGLDQLGSMSDLSMTQAADLIRRLQDAIDAKRENERLAHA